MSVSIIEAHRFTEGSVIRSHCVLAGSLAVLTIVFKVSPERGTSFLPLCRQSSQLSVLKKY